MRLFLMAVLAWMLFLGCPEQPPELVVDPKATITVEAMFKTDGTLVTGVTQQRINFSWATTLIRGAHGIAHLPFDSLLFDKHYIRILTFQDGSKDTVAAWTDFRTHQESDPNIKWARDHPKVPLDFGQIATDIQASSVWDSLRAVELGTASEHLRWSWGSEEVKLFAVFRFTDMTIAKWDSIRGDSVKWSIGNIANKLDALGFGAMTLEEVNASGDFTAREKAWFLKKITDAGFTWNQAKNVTLRELYLDWSHVVPRGKWLRALVRNILAGDIKRP